jgi:hypothetical protein
MEQANREHVVRTRSATSKPNGRAENSSVFRERFSLAPRTKLENIVMNRTALAAIALLSTIATPLVVNATGRTAAPETTVAMVRPAVTTPADAPAAAPENCRRVKVVYPGYGLPSGATTCAASSAQR